MKIETVAIDSVFPDPSNARSHPDKNLDTLRASFSRFGQVRPILVGHDGVIIAGNGFYSVMKEAGVKMIAVVRTTLKGSDATAYGITDNASAEQAEWNKPVLADLLTSLRQEDASLLEATGFSSTDVDALVAELAPPAAPPEFPAVDETLRTDHQCPKCGYEWSGSSHPKVRTVPVGEPQADA